MYQQKLEKIKCIILDIDGVLTDGNLLLMPDGNFVRQMNVKDGFAINLAIQKGYFIAIISGGTGSGVIERLKALGINEIYTKVTDKVDVLKEIIEIHGIEAQSIVYMGDDIPDYEIMQKVGLSTCPNDAVEEIKSVVDYISPIKGGKGCVRDIIEQILKSQNQWN